MEAQSLTTSLSQPRATMRSWSKTASRSPAKAVMRSSLTRMNRQSAPKQIRSSLKTMSDKLCIRTELKLTNVVYFAFNRWFLNSCICLDCFWYKPPKTFEGKIFYFGGGNVMERKTNLRIYFRKDWTGFCKIPETCKTFETGICKSPKLGFANP